MHAYMCRPALQSDLETFSNPYTDSLNLHSSPEHNVNMVLAGIDIETPELLPADCLNGRAAAPADGQPVFLLVYNGSSGLG